LCSFSDWLKNYRRKKEAKMYRGPLICPKFIFLLLCRADHGLLPIPHGSFLQYIEEPLISEERKKELRLEEEKFRDEIRSWKIAIPDLCK